MDGLVRIYTMHDFVKHFFEPFNKAVGEKKFKKLEYKIWKNLQNWSRNSNYSKMKIERDKHINHLGIIHWVWQVGPTDNNSCVPNPEVMHIDDGSFGSYLSERFGKTDMYYSDSADALASAISNSTTDTAICASTIATDYSYPLVIKDGEWVNYDNNTGSTKGTIELNTEEIRIKDQSLSEYVKQMVDDYYTHTKEKENKKDMKFGNFDFGPVGADVHMSMYGMAIKNASGTYVSYDAASKQIMDVDILNFEGANKFMYKMPVAIKDVAVGDVVVHARKPMFVTEIRKDGKLIAIDPHAGEEKTIMLSRSPFGFDFVTKVISLISFNGANSANPFGNLLPLMLMSDNSGKDNDALLMMAMMSNGTNGFANNPMMLWALMENRTNDPMMLALMMSQCGFGVQPTGCNGNCHCHDEK